jgi:hypothetical protein
VPQPKPATGGRAAYAAGRPAGNPIELFEPTIAEAKLPDSG